MYPRVLRSVFPALGRFKDYSVEFKEESEGIYCYVRTWDVLRLKRVCVLMEDLDARLPRAEFSCLCRIASSVGGSKFPVTVVGGTSSLINCLNAVRDDGMTFVPYRPFTPVVSTKCVKQAHQDFFGMIDIVTVIDYLMSRLRTALHENWLDGHVVLRRCVRAGRVSFEELPAVAKDLVSLWQPISILCVTLVRRKSRRKRTM